MLLLTWRKEEKKILLKILEQCSDRVNGLLIEPKDHEQHASAQSGGHSPESYHDSLKKSFHIPFLSVKSVLSLS